MVCIWWDRGKRDPGCIWHRRDRDRRQRAEHVRDEITAQNITATDDAAELTNGKLQPGQAITTGAEARAFADIMEHHALEATEGKQYAEMGRFLTPAGKDTNDEALAAKTPDGRPVENGLRNMWVTETALTTALNTSFFAERVAYFSIVMGVALLLTGIGFLVLTLGGALGYVALPKRRGEARHGVGRDLDALAAAGRRAGPCDPLAVFSRSAESRLRCSNGNHGHSGKRLGRRDPPRRRNAPTAAAHGRRQRGAARLLPRALEPEPPPPLPRLPEPAAAAGRVAARSGLGRARSARSARSRTRTGSGSSRSATTCACAIRRWRSPPSPSPTRSRGEGSGRGSSSGLPRAPPASGSSASSPRCCPRTGRCSASSSGQASS